MTSMALRQFDIPRRLLPRSKSDLFSLVLMAVFIFLHLWKLEEIPSGFFIDEVAIGLSAFEISRTLGDEHGVFLPIFFESLGDYKHPFHIYLTSILFWIFDPSYFLLRFASSISYIIAFLVGTFLVKNLSSFQPTVVNFWIISFGALPMLFPISRISFGVNTSIALAMITLAFINWTFASNSTKPKLARIVALGVSIGLWIYTYPTAIVSAYLTCFFILLIYGFSKNNIRYFALLVLIVMIFSIPFLIILLTEPHMLIARFKGLSYTQYSLPPFEMVSAFTFSYLNYFSYDFLLKSGDTLIRHGLPQFGIIFYSTAILSIAGIISVIMNLESERSKFGLFLVLFAFAAPIPAALVSDDQTHTLRAHLLAHSSVLLACFGVDAIARSVGGEHWQRIRFLVIGGTAVEALLYIFVFFAHYPTYSIFGMASFGLEPVYRRAFHEDPSSVILFEKYPMAPHLRFASTVHNKSETVAISVMNNLTFIPGACYVSRWALEGEFQNFPQPRLTYHPSFYVDYLGYREGGPIYSMFQLRCY